MNNFNLCYTGSVNGNYNFNYLDKRLVISFPDSNICRIQIQGAPARKSIMIDMGFVKEKLVDIDSIITESETFYKISTDRLVAIVSRTHTKLSIIDSTENAIFEILDYSGFIKDKGHLISIGMSEDERFYGFGFQRKTFDARGHVLSFKKEYRWDEATVPYFLSLSGYGFFSANTYDHEFDFTGNDSYSVEISGGDVDFFVIHGPGFKNIIDSYTAISGRPNMIPAWGLGLCYAARLFENQAGLIEIAEGFRKEGIPCDMLGVEPGWEEHYYQMKWVWNRDMFPNPRIMIDKLHEMGYAFELWESGDAPTTGYMNSKNRKKWFDERIASSLGIGVDFFKQDDPYPRCISSEEMVTNPAVDIFIEDDEGYTEAETKNIANTLYSKTVFDEMREFSGIRAFVIFHSYGSSISSQMYPCAWAGDFKLGNGALNASLSGHSMVTQDMRSETPEGIHFGFLLPFAFMDSWAYYLEPWLFSNHIMEMVKFYSRLRTSLFPYLYTTLWQSHTTGLPMLRPMVLEYQKDPESIGLEEQYMLGDSFLVGLMSDRGSSIYLPEGKWINYWTREMIDSKGSKNECYWPSFTGGPLFVKAGSIIPMMNATDSISINKRDFLFLDIYTGKDSSVTIYEDDGLTYGYENGEFTLLSCVTGESDDFINININEPVGNYIGQDKNKAVLIRVFTENSPVSLRGTSGDLPHADSIDKLLYSFGSGWFFSYNENAVYIKDSSNWKFSGILEDIRTFYNGVIEWREKIEFAGISLTIKKGQITDIPLKKTYGTHKESVSQPPVSKYEFRIIINPPERVRLNHGDDWLPYYIYAGYEIIGEGQQMFSFNKEVTLEISCDDNRDIVKKHIAATYEGSGHFERITLGSATEPLDVTLTFSADGVIPKTIRYNPPNAS